MFSFGQPKAVPARELASTDDAKSLVTAEVSLAQRCQEKFNELRSNISLINREFLGIIDLEDFFHVVLYA